MNRHFGTKSRATAGGPQPGSLAHNTPRDLEFDPFEALPESRELSDSPFNEATLILLLLFGGAIVVLLVVFYAVLRAIGL